MRPDERVVCFCCRQCLWHPAPEHRQVGLHLRDAGSPGAPGGGRPTASGVGGCAGTPASSHRHAGMCLVAAQFDLCVQCPFRPVPCFVCACLCVQIVAFCLYSAPLYYMAERLLRVNNKPLPLRILARLPVCEWCALRADTHASVSAGESAGGTRRSRCNCCVSAVPLAPTSAVN